jgi:hypothetical protein
MSAYSLGIATNAQGFVQVGIQCSVCPKPLAEYRIKKLIICSFADRIPSDRTTDDSNTKADVYSFSPACTKPLVSTRFVISIQNLNS